MAYAETASPANLNEPDADALQEKHVWCKQAFESAEQLSQDNRRRQERDRDYYDNKQLTAKEIAALEKRGQPPLTRPFIKRKIDYIVGLEIKKRSDPKAYPRTPKHEQDADAVTQAVRYAAEQAKFKQVKTGVTREFMIEGGPCGAYIGVKRKANGKVEPTVIRIPWDRCFADPHSREPDFSDATYKGFIVWKDAKDAEREFPDAKDVIEQTVAKACTDSTTYDDRPRWQKWVDTKRKRVRIVEIYYDEGGKWHCAAYTEAGFVKNPAPVEFLDQDGETDCPLELTSANCDRENNRYGEVRGQIDIQDSVNKRVSKLTHLLTVRQARFGRGVKDADKQSKELAKPDGKIVADKDEFEVLPTNDLAAGQAQMLQFDLMEMQQAGPNASLMGKGPESASGRAILANQQGGQIELEPLMDALSVWELNCYRKIWHRIRQYWTEKMWLRVTDDPRNLRWVGLNAPMTMGDYAQRQGQKLPPDADPSAPMLGPDGQPAMMNQLAEIDVDIILDKGPDTITIQQEQFEVLAQIQGIPPDVLIELSSLPNKERVIDRLSGKVGPGGSEPQPPPPPPEVIKAQADAQEKDKQREFEAAKAVGDRQAQESAAQLQAQKDAAAHEREIAKLMLEREKAEAAHRVELAKLALAQEQLSVERERLQLEAAKIAQAARDAEESRSLDRDKTQAEFAHRAAEREVKAGGAQGKKESAVAINLGSEVERALAEHTKQSTATIEQLAKLMAAPVEIQKDAKTGAKRAVRVMR